MRSFRVASLVVAAALSLTACGATSTPTPSSAGSAAPSGGSAVPSAGGGVCTVAPDGMTPAATVTIRDFKYDPGTVTIKAGEAVAWTNEDSSSHTATTSDGGCDTGPISKGKSVTLVFPTAGTYTYTCKIHTTMPTATVEVTE